MKKNALNLFAIDTSSLCIVYGNVGYKLHFRQHILLSGVPASAAVYFVPNLPKYVIVHSQKLSTTIGPSIQAAVLFQQN